MKTGNVLPILFLLYSCMLTTSNRYHQYHALQTLQFCQLFSILTFFRPIFPCTGIVTWECLPRQSSFMSPSDAISPDVNTVADMQTPKWTVSLSPLSLPVFAPTTIIVLSFHLPNLILNWRIADEWRFKKKLKLKTNIRIVHQKNTTENHLVFVRLFDPTRPQSLAKQTNWSSTWKPTTNEQN